MNTAQDYALIDLHLHLDGSLSVETVRELADLQGIALPHSAQALTRLLQVDKDCKDLNEYLEKFQFPCQLLQTEAALEIAVVRLLQDLQAQGLIYAEIRFAPQQHTNKGLTQEQVVEAAIRGMNRSTLSAGLILCCMRGDGNRDANMETVYTAKKYLGRGVCGLDLAGAEALYPAEAFQEMFRLAVKLDVPFTIHAGEADGSRSVYAALELGARRIGHGVRSVEDKALMEKLARERIALELCPTSNLHTRIFAHIQAYPLRTLMEAGVKVTVNTDNMTVSGTTLAAELEQVARTFSLTKQELRLLAWNAVDASFASEEMKRKLRQEMENRLSLHEIE